MNAYSRRKPTFQGISVYTHKIKMRVFSIHIVQFCSTQNRSIPCEIFCEAQKVIIHKTKNVFTRDIQKKNLLYLSRLMNEPNITLSRLFYIIRMNRRRMRLVNQRRVFILFNNNISRKTQQLSMHPVISSLHSSYSSSILLKKLLSCD